MTTLVFTDDELLLLRHALSAFLSDFGHDEKDVRRSLNDLLAKIHDEIAA
jgi:hypothetical protein